MPNHQEEEDFESEVDHSFGFNGNKTWVNHGCRGTFNVTLAGGSGQEATGLSTIDTVDGHVKQHYGVAWRQCDAGAEDSSEIREMS